jgi:hypothetical protein
VSTERITIAAPRQQETERDYVFGPGSDSGLQVIVVRTTEEGTLAALKAAGALAENLGAQIGLAVIEVVPFRLPLDRPPVPVDFLKRQQYALISEAAIEAQEVKIQICLCRDRNHTLGRLLAPHSLVLIGGKRCWYSTRERKLEKQLSKLGHHVIFVELRDAELLDSNSLLSQGA